MKLNGVVTGRTQYEDSQRVQTRKAPFQWAALSDSVYADWLAGAGREAAAKEQKKTA